MKFCRAAVTQKDPGRGPIGSFLLADTGFISRLSVSADNKSCHFGRILVSAKMKKLHVSRAYVKAVSMDGWTEHRHESISPYVALQFASLNVTCHLGELFKNSSIVAASQIFPVAKGGSAK